MKKLSIIHRIYMPQAELENYHRTLRKYEYEHHIQVSGLKTRLFFHKLVRGLILVESACSKVHVKVIGDDSIHTEKPIIYACTHIGRYDVESNFVSHKDHFYIFYGDPGATYRSVDGLLLNMNGVIYADTDSKEDRMIGKEACVKLLEQGGNLLIYPEGAWNITENEPVMKLFTGAVEMAIRGGAEIIPIAMENYGNTYHVNIGRNIDYSAVRLEQKREKTDELRDIMSTLKWEIWEKQGLTRRRELPADYAGTFIDNIMNQTVDGYTVEEINRTRFHDTVPTPEEAFGFMKNLKPCKANAFLFRGNKYLGG
jgi:1-acyl-sn-glycerol-3-phosphate acyltransferase